MKIDEKQLVSIGDIQTLIREKIGESASVFIKNKQGKIIKEYAGVIVDSYASHFVLKIRINNNFINKSFTYVDFLTNETSVEIK